MPHAVANRVAATIAAADTLAGLRAAGVTHVNAYCVGRPGRCKAWAWFDLDTLLQQGVNTTLVRFARRLRCSACGAHGAHVQAALPPVFGQPTYLDWLVAERQRAAAFLAETEEFVAASSRSATVEKTQD